LSTDKIKTVNNYHLLQASNKAAGGETARHQDTRAVSGGTPAAKHNMHRKYKRFLGKYPITSTYQAQANLDQRFADSKILFHLFASS
jgi:hypothetical protein